MILSARRCSTRVALTEAPETSGVPVDTLSPSPTINTSASSIVEPGSPTSFSTAITSSGATLYCLPPVRMIANIAKAPSRETDIGVAPAAASPRGAETAADRPSRPRAAHYRAARSPVNAQSFASVLWRHEHIADAAHRADCLRCDCGAGDATQSAFDARQQLAWFKRLGDIVVGAGFEPDDAVDRVCRRRDHDDADPGAAFAQPSRQGEPVFSGQSDVEHHQ